MKSRDSSDSEDSIPLGIIKSIDYNSYNSLQEPVREQCDFCDQVFKTRFASIKHSATHIIIPLLKLSLHQCSECLFHFCSLEDLHTHTKAKNHRTAQFSEINLSPIKYNEVLKSIIEKQVVISCHNTLSTDLPKVNSTPSLDLSLKELDSVAEVEKSSEPKVEIYEISSDSENESSHREHNPGGGKEIPVREQDIPVKEQSIPERELSIPEWELSGEDRSSPINYSSKEPSSPSHKGDLPSPVEPIQSRITFEDDIDDDDLFESEEILPVKRYNSHIDNNVYSFDNFNTQSYNSQSLSLNSIIIGSQNNRSLLKPMNGTLNGRGNDEVECFTDSVHYEELIEPNSSLCRYCGECFCNRLELIKHESIHMRARPARLALCSECERFIAGNYRNLRKHMQQQHPTHNHNKLNMHRCNICHLSYYNYQRHVSNYHDSKCKLCNRSFDNQFFDSHNCNQFYNKCKTCNKMYDPIKSHVCEMDLVSDTYKVIKMCEMCLAFAKNRQNIHYEVLKEYSELGARQQCDRCNNKYFAVFLVKRKVKCREGTEPWKRRKPMSNQERLKKMQNRLKMVNKLNKC